MFGQTDGSGLNNDLNGGHGRALQDNGLTRAADGVKVAVSVPEDIRAAMKARMREAAAATIRVPEKRDETARLTRQADSKSAKPIRIVEFDANTGAARNIGR